MTIKERLSSNSPKRIRSIDGGGILGSVALGYLSEIERQLRARHNNPQMFLSDYFDLIGGTNTGAIIAASLAFGLPAEEIQNRYEEMGIHTPKRQAFCMAD